MSELMMKRGALLAILLVILPLFSFSTWLFANRFAADKLSLTDEVEINDPEAVAYILRWQTKRRSPGRITLPTQPWRYSTRGRGVIFYRCEREYPPLHYAARYGHTETIHQLLQAGYAVNQIHDPIGTPADNAVIHNQLNALEALLAAGGEADRCTMLYAVYFGRSSCCRLMLNKGCDLPELSEASLRLVSDNAARHGKNWRELHELLSVHAH